MDEGWRVSWWEHLKYDLTLESIRGDARFQSIYDEIEADMAEQLARVREMEFSGEIVAPP